MLPFYEGRGWTEKHTDDELREVALEAQAGDEAAKERLVVMMRPYLVNLLRKVPGDYTRDQKDEMTAAALVGLFEALKRYDPSKQATTGKRSFSNYALNWVRHEVYEWQAKNSRALPVPRKAWNYAKRIEEAWLDENPGGDISMATDEELSAIELVVKRGTPGTAPARGSQRGDKEDVAITVDYAGDIIRAKRQPYSYDPEYHPHETTASAEDVYFKDSDDAQALRIASLMVSALQEVPDEEQRAWLAESMVANQGWPKEVVELLLERAAL